MKRLVLPLPAALALPNSVNCVSRLLQVGRKKILCLITVIELSKLKGR